MAFWRALCAIGLVTAQIPTGDALARSRSHPRPPASAQAATEPAAPLGGPPPRSTAQLATGLKEHLSPIWTAVYECRNKTAEGCSAGCASASFSPIQRLTVVLGSVAIANSNLPIYYYLAEFPAGSANKANSVAKAEGFIMDAHAVCGTVNMDLTFSDSRS